MAESEERQADGTQTGQTSRLSRPQQPRSQAFEKLGFVPAEAHFGEITYVDYYVRDPATGAKRRMRIKLGRVPASQRRAYARKLVWTLNQKLASGWNPFEVGETPKAFNSLGDALDAYEAVKVRDTRHSSPKTYVSFVRIFRDWCRAHGLLERSVTAFNRTRALKFLDHLIEERQVGNTTYNNYVLRCSIMMIWMMEREYRSDNPFKGIKRKRKVEKFRTLISSEERSMCMAWFQKNDPPMVLICMWVFHTLLRPRSELLRIRVRDLDLTNGVVNVDGEDSKSALVRRAAIPNAMMPFIQASPLMSAAPSDYLVGKGLLPGPIKCGHNTVGNRWAAMRTAIGWSADKELYSLRDSGIVQLIADGVDLHYVMRQAGHKNIETTNRYVQHYFPSGLEAVRRKATPFKGVPK